MDRYRKDRRSAPGRDIEDSGKGLDAYLEGAEGSGYGGRGKKDQRTNKDDKVYPTRIIPIPSISPGLTIIYVLAFLGMDDAS